MMHKIRRIRQLLQQPQLEQQLQMLLQQTPQALGPWGTLHQAVM